MKSAFELRPLVEADIPLLQTLSISGVDVESMVGGQRYMGWADMGKGFEPAAIVDVNETIYVIEPHITWFPWTSNKTQYLAFKWFIEIQDKTVFMPILKEVCGFYDQWVKRGLLRKIGVLKVSKEAGEEIHMYQKIEVDNE